MSTHTASPNARSAGPSAGGAPGHPSRVTAWRRWPAILRWTRLIPVLDLVAPEQFTAFLAASIREISPYYSRARISTTIVRLDEVHPVSRTVEARRLKRARRLVRLMRQRDRTFFESCLLKYRGEASYHLVLPPVVERAGGNLVVVDGVHRLTALDRSDHHPKDVSVVLIRDSRLPRPAAVPCKLSDIEVTYYDPKPSVKFRRLQPDLFRPTGSTLRSRIFAFQSVEEFVTVCEGYGRK